MKTMTSSKSSTPTAISRRWTSTTGIRARAGSLAIADPPEDSRVTIDREDAAGDYGGVPATMDEIRGLRADAGHDLDLFESGLDRY
jgi:hypothetical protein